MPSFGKPPYFRTDYTGCGELKVQEAMSRTACGGSTRHCGSLERKGGSSGSSWGGMGSSGAPNPQVGS